MAYYRDRVSGSYITLQSALSANPNISVGTPLSASDYDALSIDPVIETPRPSVTLTQKVVLAPAVQDDNGNWETDYTIIDLTENLTPTQLITFKQNIANILSDQIDAQETALVDAGFKYDFSAYSTDAGIVCSTLTPNGTPGVLTIQMDTKSQIKWLGITSLAKDAIAACTYAVTGLALTTDGAGYTPGTGYALTATGSGYNFAGTVDVDATGNLTNLEITSGGVGYKGSVTIEVDISAGTPTTPGNITAIVSQPSNFALRVLENYNVILPAPDVVTILTNAALWETTQIFAAAGLKDQLQAMVNDPTVVPSTILTVTWPTAT